MSASEVDDYLSSLPQPQRATLLALRATLRRELPSGREAITYGIPTFLVDDLAVAGYSASKNHCSYHPMSGTVLAKLQSQIADYDWSKGTLRFGPAEPLPVDLVSALVRARLDEATSNRD